MKRDWLNKQKGLYKKYKVTKINNPTKKLKCIVLEFDDPISRVGIEAFANECQRKCFFKLASDLRDELVFTKGSVKERE